MLISHWAHARHRHSKAERVQLLQNVPTTFCRSDNVVARTWFRQASARSSFYDQVSYQTSSEGVHQLDMFIPIG
jgi:hypothetical protein